MELVSLGNLFHMFASSRHAAYSVVPIGTYAEYVLSTMDKVVNWARQGSMWPMTCERPPFLFTSTHLGLFKIYLDFDLVYSRSRMLRRRDDAHGRRTIRSGSIGSRLPSVAPTE